MSNLIKKIPVPLLVVLCLTLGLAPFSPTPHVLEKSVMLINGELTKMLDIFDFFFHGIPWLLLALRLILKN